MIDRASVIMKIKLLTTRSVDAMRRAADAMERPDADVDDIAKRLRDRSDDTETAGKDVLSTCIKYFVDEVWGEEKLR